MVKLTKNYKKQWNRFVLLVKSLYTMEINDKAPLNNPA